MVEAALYRMGEMDYDLVRVDYAVNMFRTWYLGMELTATVRNFIGIIITVLLFSQCWWMY